MAYVARMPRIEQLAAPNASLFTLQLQQLNDLQTSFFL